MLVARLIRVTGDWDLAEDCVQDACEKALAHWPRDGIPQAPAAWLTAVARHRAVDVIRRRATERTKLTELGMDDWGLDEGRDPLDDDRLRLLFTCCHPALPLEGRVALTLKVVAGLSTADIGRAFLVSEATMGQRLLRTKRKISHAAIPYRTPPPELLAERTGGVLATVYLIFNAGYDRPGSRLAVEAQRLAGLLVALMPGEAEAHGLLALITFQLARRATRFDASGELLPMEEQDRGQWDPAGISEGQRHLRRALGSPKPPGAYALQAAIAAVHARAPTADVTDWSAIVRWYDALLDAHPSPVVALNRAVAVGFRDGFAAGLAALAALDPAPLAGYHLLPAARADFLRRLGRADEARDAYAQAIGLAPGGPERRLLERRVAELG